MSAIYRKELKIYFSGMFGWFTVAIFLLFSGLFVTVFHLLSGYTDLTYTLSGMHWVLMVLVPLIAMRGIAEERHSRTDQLLYTLPLPLWEIVLAKYLAMLTLFAIPTAILALYPLLLTAFGQITLSSAYVALLGYFLLGASLIAMSMFLSSLVENQILAAVICVLAILGVYFISTVSALIPASPLLSFLLCVAGALVAAAVVWRTSKNLNLGLIAAIVLVLPTALVYIVKPALFASLVPNFLMSIDLFARYGGFSYGYLDLTGVVFYLTFIAVFVYLTWRTMEKRRAA